MLKRSITNVPSNCTNVPITTYQTVTRVRLQLSHKQEKIEIANYRQKSLLQIKISTRIFQTESQMKNPKSTYRSFGIDIHSENEDKKNGSR